MQPTITHNGIIFIDAQAMRLAFPETFAAPNKEELDRLKIRDYVKICVNDERFWVFVTEIKDDIVRGSIRNELLQESLKYEDIIEFPKVCIYQINY